MVKKTITIGHLYPEDMNTYGDMGNIITLRYRLESRGYTVKYVKISRIKDLIALKPEILIGGGGQDSSQELVQVDITRNKQELASYIQDGRVGLMVCGMYQMLGHVFVLPNGKSIMGAGIFNIETMAGEDRLIGNAVAESNIFGRMIGFENHSGRTYLGDSATPLGVVIKGAGNNGQTGDEGVVYKNMFGTYLHGPVLAKNPRFADGLIKLALNLKELMPLDDRLELRAAAVASRRP